MNVQAKHANSGTVESRIRGTILSFLYIGGKN